MHPGDLRRLRFPFGDEVRLGEEGLELVEDRLVQRQERIVGELDLLRPGGQRLVQLDEGDRAAVDADLEAEVEPVVLVRLDRGDLHVRLPAELPVRLLLPARDDLDVFDLLEPGQDVDDEIRGVRVVEFDVLDARQGGAGFVGVGEEFVDLSDDGIFEVEFALLRIFPRRGGAEPQSVDDGEGAAGSLVFPVPA